MQDMQNDQGAQGAQDAKSTHGSRPSDNINRYDMDTSQLDADDADLMEVELPEDLQKVLFYAFDEAVKNLESQGELLPFTVTLAGDDIYVDSFDDPDECADLARESVNIMAHIADAYVFCYDGFIQFEDGSESDMVIAEIGEKGQSGAQAYGLIYSIGGDGVVEYDEALVELDEVENLFDPEAVAAAEEIAAAVAAADAEVDAMDAEEDGE